MFILQSNEHGFSNNQMEFMTEISAITTNMNDYQFMGGWNNQISTIFVFYYRSINELLPYKLNWNLTMQNGMFRGV